MKKRKELDALVPNGKVKKKPSSASSHELLRVDSDSTDTEEYAVLQARKFAPKKTGWFSRMCTTCAPLCTLTLVTACVVGSGILLWMQFGIRQEVDLLRDHLRQVEENNKGTASEFHSIHSQLNGLQKNQTALKDDVAKLNKTLETMLKELATLTKTAADLQKSVAEAPQLEKLPADVNSILKSVALMGSQISDLQSNLTPLKDQLANNDKEKQQLQTGVDELKKKVDALVLEQQKLSEKKSTASFENIDISRLQETLAETNNSIWQKLQWTIADLHEHHKIITELQALTQNLTQRIVDIEASPVNVSSITATVLQDVQAKIKSLINATFESHMEKILPDSLPALGDANGTVTIETLLGYLSSLTKLYVALVAKSQALPKGQLQAFNETLSLNLAALVQEAVNGYVNATVGQQDAKIKDLHSSINVLSASYQTIRQSSDALQEKMAALREEIGKMHADNLTLQQGPPEPPAPVTTAKTSPGTSVLQTQPPALNSSLATNESLTAAVSTASPSTTTLTLNGTAPSNSSATPGHIPKPSHTGGSLPDDDGAPKSGSATN